MGTDVIAIISVFSTISWVTWLLFSSIRRYKVARLQADMEKASLGNTPKRWRTMVVLPVPEGPATIINLPLDRLIEY